MSEPRECPPLYARVVDLEFQLANAIKERDEARAKIEQLKGQLDVRTRTAVGMSRAGRSLANEFGTQLDAERIKVTKLREALNGLPFGTLHNVKYLDANGDAICHKHCPACLARQVLEDTK